MECFYVEEETLYLNSLPAVKIPLSDIDYVEFYYTRIRISYRGQIKVHKKNGKVVKRFFQTSKISLIATEKMVLDNFIYIPQVYATNHFAIKANVQGLGIFTYGYQFDFKHVAITK